MLALWQGWWIKWMANQSIKHMAAAYIQQQPWQISVIYVQLVGSITESCYNFCCEYAAAEADAAATAAVGYATMQQLNL